MQGSLRYAKANSVMCGALLLAGPRVPIAKQLYVDSHFLQDTSRSQPGLRTNCTPEGDQHVTEPDL